MQEVLSGIANPKIYGIEHDVYVLKIECGIFWGEMIFPHQFSLHKKVQWN